MLKSLKKFPQKTSTFVGEVKGELRKASWPWDPDPKVKGFKKIQGAR
jgi:preprotein translocase subunit SecE